MSVTLKRMEAVIFIGLQGAGKTTFYEQRFKTTHVRISLDALKTRHREQRLLEACIKQGKRFVVDNTNPSILDRQRYIQPARRAGYAVIGYYFESKLSECLRRNRLRTGNRRIPDVALFRAANRLELPSFEEGYDDLGFVRIDSDGKFIVVPWKRRRLPKAVE